MKRCDGSPLAMAAILVLFSQAVMAVPTFQAYEDGSTEMIGNWYIAPGSHDSTYHAIPAPGAVLLGTIGVSIIGWLRRRSTL